MTNSPDSSRTYRLFNPKTKSMATITETNGEYIMHKDNEKSYKISRQMAYEYIKRFEVRKWVPSISLLAIVLLGLIGCGSEGRRGVPGSNGHSISTFVTNVTACVNGGYTVLMATDSNDDGVWEPEDSEQRSFTVCNGTNGTNATPEALTVVDPCGDSPAVHDEVLLKLGDGTLLASFSDNASGLNTHFALLTDGSYVTTDGSACYFSVVNGEVVNAHY